MRKHIVTAIATLALVAAAVVAGPAPAQATAPQGLATTVLCPSGSGSCTEYRYGFSVPGTSGQLGIYYTVQWSSSGASYKVARVRIVNNTYGRVYFDDIGFVYASHYYTLRVNYGGSVQSGTSVSFTDGAFGGLSGTGVGKYVPRGSGEYATANPNDSTTWYSTLGSPGITGAFVLS